MFVFQQYGSQSDNPSLNTLKEVLTDATYGIIPKYVNKVMASATSSGYTIDTTKIADITSDFRYLWFPGKPALQCLNDCIDLVSAANAPSAGAHWTAVPDGTTCYLCVATVGNHENPPADVWPTWWNTDQSGSTIVVKSDMVLSQFRKVRSEGNYVLFAGTFRRPVDGDKWTENTASSWGVYDPSSANASASDDASVYKIGSKSVKFNIGTALNDAWFYYPSGVNLNLDVTKISTKSSVPHIGFWIRRNSGVHVSGGGETQPSIMLGTGAVTNFDFFEHVLQSTSFTYADKIPETDKWYHVSAPLGPYAATSETQNWDWRESGSPDWSDIDWIGFRFHASSDNAALWVDGIRIEGLLVRAAYDSSKFTSQKCRMVFFRDDVPKDDTLVASDDSGELAQFAKAELYRNMQEPTVGTITVPLQPSIKAGQLAHIKYGVTSSGTYRIDSDMRILEVTHEYGPMGAKSTLSLTTDVTNSRPLSPTSKYNLLLKATAPQFQDRVRASLISNVLDVNQAILAKDYA